MVMEIFRSDERTPSAWKNGGGVTREVAAEPPGAGLDDFTWRISLADVVHSGSFSVFSGIDRIITVVDGPGMRLVVDGVPRRVDPHEPFAFSGDAVTECALPGGPIVDFNVMVRRTRATAHVRIVREQATVRSDRAVRVLAMPLTGSAVLQQAGVTLQRLDAALLSDGDQDVIGVTGVAAVVTLTATSGRPSLC
ncbi:HutD family protein [Streptomyces sp. NPDC101234]|uniref:HutD/Ves family protein n=1 Tax=Streptomyces sp. NPDC101234 TaxID=3366138 RepID=UPI003807A70C